MKVFLSYSSSDEKFARELRQRLTELGLQVWDPDAELPRASNWLLETGRALERADSLVFVFSDEATRSQARREVEYAITRPKFEGRVVSVRLSPRAEVPWILETMPVIDAKPRDARSAARKVASALMRHGRAATRRRAHKALGAPAKLAKSS
jgi:hypothetical protein